MGIEQPDRRKFLKTAAVFSAGALMSGSTIEQTQQKDLNNSDEMFSPREVGEEITKPFLNLLELEFKKVDTDVTVNDLPNSLRNVIWQYLNDYSKWFGFNPEQRVASIDVEGIYSALEIVRKNNLYDPRVYEVLNYLLGKAISRAAAEAVEKLPPPKLGNDSDI
jgi:hypothetical protein